MPIAAEMNSNSKGILLGLYCFGQSYMHVPSMLARTGMPVDAVVTRKHPLRRSRWLRTVTEVDESKWAETIDERLSSGEYVFFTNTDEPGLIALYKHKWSEPARRFLTFDPDSSLAKTVGDKWAFYAWCRARGLPIPETYEFEASEEVDKRAVKLDGKWLLKGASGMGGRSVWPWDEPRHTPSPFKAGGVSPVANKWMLQKHEGEAVGAAMFIAIRGKLLAWFGVRKKVCLNRGLGPIVVGSGDCHPSIGNLCEAVARAGEITGITGFDYVVSPEKGPLLIDSHLGRMTTMNHFGVYYGVDFTKVLREALLGADIARVDPIKGPDVAKFPELIECIIKEGGSQVRRALSFNCAVPLVPDNDVILGVSVYKDVIVSGLRVRLGKFRRQPRPFSVN